MNIFKKLLSYKNYQIQLFHNVDNTLLYNLFINYYQGFDNENNIDFRFIFFEISINMISDAKKI